MCGIAGIFDPRGRPIASSEIRAMNDAIVHRGPDDRGEYVEAGVGLANRRLAIIDLSPAGHQPMANEDGTRPARLQRRALQLPGARAAARGARAPLSLEDRQRGRRPRLRGVGPGLRRALQRHVRVRDLGPAQARALPRPRSLRDQAALLHAGRRPLPLRLRGQVAAEGRCATPRLAGGARRVLHLPEPAQRPDALRRRAHASGRPHADRHRGRHAAPALLGPELRPGRRRLRRRNGPSGSAASSSRS